MALEPPTPFLRLFAKLMLCLAFVLAVDVPLVFGFQENASWGSLMGVAGIFAATTGRFIWFRRAKKKYTVTDVNGDLIYFICISLATSLPGIPIGPRNAFGFGLYWSSISGSIDLESMWYTSRTQIAASMAAMLLTAIGVFIWFRGDPITSFLIFNWISTPIACALGAVVGVAANRYIPPLLDVWLEIKRLGRVLVGYGLGYLVISVVFAGCYASLVKLDSKCIRGVLPSFNFIDYWYYSIAVMTTVLDAEPSTRFAKLVVASEVLFGIAWTVVVFAAVLSAVQKKSPITSIEN